MFVQIINSEKLNGCKEDIQQPAPPDEVLALRSKYKEPVYLIRFFDRRRNW